MKQIVRALGLVAGLAIGGLLGWMLFLTPSENAERGISSGKNANPASLDQQDLTVQTTGTPATDLSGAVKVGEIPPDFALPDLNGDVHSLGQHRGQAVILNFWTTWCPPCIFEMPALQQVYERYSDQGLTVLGINLTQSDDPDLIEPFREKLGLTFPILLDPESQLSGNLYRVLGLPTSVFIDRKGVVQEVYIGAIPLDDLESKVQLIMGDG